MRCARTASVILAGLTLAAGVVAGVLVTRSGTASAQQLPTISVSPDSGSPGSSFVITFRGFRVCQGIVYFTWDGRTPLATAKWAEIGSVKAAVPAEVGDGVHVVVGRNDCQDTARATFTVRTPTVVPTTVEPTTEPVPTTAPTVPPTTRVTTTRPSTMPSSTETTTTEPTTTVPPVSTGPSPSGDRPGGLTFDRPSVQPGEKLSASGAGCTPGQRVTLTADGDRVGGTGVTAGADGRFSTAVEFHDLRPGRREVVASCGTELTGAVDLVLTSSTSASSGTLAVLVFFLLAGVTVITRSRQ